MNSKKHTLSRKVIATLLTIAMLVTLSPASMFAGEPGSGEPTTSVTAESNGVTVNKYVSQDENGQYNLTMEAYASNVVTTTESTQPLDIVLVLDVSRSMDDSLVEETTYVQSSRTEWDILDFNGWTRYFFKDGDQYYPVSAELKDLGIRWTLSYKNDAGETIELGTMGTTRSWTGTLYTEESTEYSKLDTTKNAVNGFIDKVAASSTEHRVALVTFANDANVVSNFTNNFTDLQGKVNNLTANGATYSDEGLAQAQTLINNLSNDHQKVVIMFTDGEPGQSGFGSYNGYETAANAIGTSLAMKDNGVQVYTIGMMDGANPADTISDANLYMNAVSSNYPAAKVTDYKNYSYIGVNLGQRSSDDYYYAADSAASLNDIFKAIYDQISSLKVNPDADAVLSDTLSDFVKFPDGLTEDSEKISVQYVDAKSFDPETETITWKDNGTTQENVTVTVEGKTISITGFDYKEHAVTDDNGTVSGGKLVVTFPIEVDVNACLTDTTIDDGWYPTNDTTDSRAKLSYKSDAEAGSNDTVTVLDQSPKVQLTNLDANGTDVTVQVYVDGEKVSDPDKYVTFTRDTKDTTYDYFNLVSNTDGVLTYDFNYDPGEGGHDCVDIKVTLNDGTSYILQGVHSYQSHGKSGTENVIDNKDGTYTVDNVTSDKTNEVDCTIYLQTKYSVDYYQDETLLTDNGYDDQNVYIAGEDVTSTTAEGPAEENSAWMNWKNNGYKTTIDLQELPKIEGNVVDGWFLGSTEGTVKDPSEIKTVNVSEVTEAADNRIIKFYATTTAQHTITINYEDESGALLKEAYNDAQNDGYPYSFDVSDEQDATIPFTITQDNKKYVFGYLKDGSDPLEGTLKKNVNITAVYLPDSDGDGTPDAYEATVIYQVVNGTWENGSTNDIKVSFALKEFNEESDQWKDVNPKPTLGNSIPTDMKPNAGYANQGSWNDNITSDTSVTKDITYVYTFTAQIYTLKYDVNGGKFGDSSEQTAEVNNLEAKSYDLWMKGEEGQPDLGTKPDGMTFPTHADVTYEGKKTKVVFIGWTQDKPEKQDEIYAAGENYGTTVDNVTFADKNITVYAVWGYDTNGDNIADATQVMIQPADITIYTGGTGYIGVVKDENGNTVGVNQEGNGLPEPGFYFTLPYDVNDAIKKDAGNAEQAADLSQYLTINAEADSSTGTTEARTWTIHLYDEDDSHASNVGERYVYRFEPMDLDDKVRMQFVDPTNPDKIIFDDEFDINNALSESYIMSLYTGAVDNGKIKATVTIDEKDSEPISIGLWDSTLTVRGTTGQDTTTENVVTQVPETINTITAVEGSKKPTYYINGSQIQVSDQNVQLLVDSIVDSDLGEGKYVHDTLLEMAEKELPSSYDGAEFKYLDLVDSSNGNVWVTMGKDDTLTVYWPYPKGTDQDDDFTIIHYEGLDRDFNMNDLESQDVDIEAITPEKTAQGLKFEVSSFSPFALVYDKQTSGGGGGGTTPNPPDLNTEDHFSYVVGYEDGMVKPENAITRAEVASIFYRLLKDEVRDENTTDVSEFSDVSASDWYGTTVATLSAMDIVRGYEDGTFRPNAPITRAEFAAIATRFFEETGAEYEPGTFDDVTGDEWFANAIADAVELGLIGGYPDGTVRPNNNITRAEACAVVNRTLGRIPHVDHLLPADEMTTWPDNNPSDWFYADMQEATNGHEYEWTKEDGQKVEEWTEILDKDWEDR